MIKRLWEYKKIRFLCIGSFNSLVDLTILNTLVFVAHFPIWAANTISVSIGITISYFLNHFIVFKYHKSTDFRNFMKFFLVTGLSVVVLQTIIIYLTKPIYTNLLVHHVHVLNTATLRARASLNLAKVTAILVGMVWNFTLYSRLVFASKSTDVEEEARDITGIV